MMKIDALWLIGKESVEVRQAQIADEPAYDEIQVEVKACGICAWDRYLYRGMSLKEPFPFMFGHESAGRVLKVGAGVKDFNVGDDVFCIDGGTYQMAQVVNTRASAACKISVQVDDYANFVLEPAVCVASAMASLPFYPGDRVALVGAGYMGLLHLQLLMNSYVGSLVAFELRENCIERSRKLGVETYHSESEQGRAAVERIRQEKSADIVIDCSGTESGFALSNELMRPGGLMSLFAWHRGERVLDATAWHIDGYRVLSTAPAMNPHFADNMARAERLAAKGSMNHKDLITHVCDYKHAHELFPVAYKQQDGYLKGIITF